MSSSWFEAQREMLSAGPLLVHRPRGGTGDALERREAVPGAKEIKGNKNAAAY